MSVAVVGQVHSRYSQDGQPDSLAEWRVATRDPNVAARVDALYPGGTATIDVIVADSTAIRQRIALWDDDGKPVCNPSAELTFRLADDPELGIFVLKSNSWGLARFLAAEDIEGQIDAVGGPAVLRLKLVPVTWRLKSGPPRRKVVRFTALEIEVLGAARAPQDAV